VTEAVIVDAIVTLGVRTVKELRTATGAGEGCTCCLEELREYLEVHADARVASYGFASAVAGVCDPGPTR
ncbi:MAG: (2Fe-2S)-binding protein, partial [Planctomycetia bacterium]|nr:(2Fe-2S)-binding protein [Planctomycetia bacterium]